MNSHHHNFNNAPNMSGSVINLSDWDEIITPKLVNQILGDIDNKLISIQQEVKTSKTIIFNNIEKVNTIENNIKNLTDFTSNTSVENIKQLKQCENRFNQLDKKIESLDEKINTLLNLITEIKNKSEITSMTSSNNKLFVNSPIYPAFLKMSNLGSIGKPESIIKDNDKEYIEYNRMKNKLIRNHEKCSFIPDIKSK